MGQMHIQRAIEVPNGPQTLIATDVNDERLAVVAQQFAPLVAQHGKRLITSTRSRPAKRCAIWCCARPTARVRMM